MLRKLLALVVFVSFSSFAVAQSDKSAAEGWMSMFDGKTFDGWRFSGGKLAAGEMPKNWSVGEGMIRLSGGGAPHLASQWTFDDFEMKFAWKAYKKPYNSGFYVRSERSVGKNQINLESKTCGNLLGYPKGVGPGVPELQHEPGQWNDWRVLAVGSKLQFWVNGKDAWTVDVFKPASGYVGLQAEGAKIDFKDLYVREIGYRVLGEAENWVGGDWTHTGDVFKGTKTMTSKDAFDGGTIRLEYQSDGGTIKFGTKGMLSLADKALPSNPTGQWNYLQIATKADKTTVWCNGTDVKLAVEAGGAGPIVLDPAGKEMSVRNVRVRTGK
jgi:3-keto-disaccharide hydrolase